MAKEGGSFRAFLTGTAVGAALGLLFAPRSGEETREKIVEFGEQTQETMTEGGDDLESRIKNLRGEIQTLTNQALETGQKRVQDELDALKVAFEEGRKKLQEERRRETGSEDDAGE